MKAFENLYINILKKIFCEKLKLSRTNSEDRIVEAAGWVPQNYPTETKILLIYGSSNEQLVCFGFEIIFTEFSVIQLLL